MEFIETAVAGAFIIEPQRHNDPRGFFARVFCHNELKLHGLDWNVVQCNVSFNPFRATLRGLHYQIAPHQETKLVRCTMGMIFDVIADLRPDSCTFRRWFGVELSAQSHRMLYVPKGVAHGYITLCNDSEVFYQVSEFYSPKSERGLRFDDPVFNIRWPLEPVLISDKDRCYPDFEP